MSSTVLPTSVFMMLNGANDGLFFTWNEESPCLHALGHAAALSLGADADWTALGVRLYNQQGRIVQDVADVVASRGILHVLLEFQVWTWPGIAVGHVTIVNDDGQGPEIALTTLSLSPKVLSVNGFFTEVEADAILSQGQPHLHRSLIDDNGVRGISATRTSNTAFLRPSLLTLELQVRTAKLARLPSPSFVERTQLVRYGPGEFYKRHLDTFDNKEILPRAFSAYNYSDFEAWTEWAAAVIDAAQASAAEHGTPTVVPAICHKGQPWYPNASSSEFIHSVLHAFWTFANTTNFFESRFDQAWDDWLAYNLGVNASGLMHVLLESKGHYLPLIVRVWEDRAGNAPALRYTFPKRRPPHGISQWYRWVRKTKEAISALGQAAPNHLQPHSALYPKFDTAFETTVLELWRRGTGGPYLPATSLPRERLHWMDQHRGHRNVLLKLVQDLGIHLVQQLIYTWEEKVQFGPVAGYLMPPFVPFVPPQRYATLFLYLNTVDKGGETVFPHARTDAHVSRSYNSTTMPECAEGMAVLPTALHAVLFYVQTPTMEVDPMARHGGCPPLDGNIKWGANQFMWNADAEEGAVMWLDST
ncbi:hypothetical protein, variant 1 [Aphanomyces invadans]|nr:hypothetical protein, variant 1 [Aphanomyces invadans]ETW02934.1 hypothetical protein, variant 1 [Aphanomyces invadans]|eukprot:XP_008868318.1 hypothetical protein, variant 1 [Aphanomyces invadans]